MASISLKRLAAAFAVAALVSFPAAAMDTPANTDTSTTDTKPGVPSLADARADIAAKHWADAIDKLKLIVADSPTDADAFNLLGYSYRNAGNYDLAGRAYVKALKLNPKHTGALEYQGVLFVKLGQLDKAKANLATIKGICGTTCEEYEDLEKAIGG